MSKHSTRHSGFTLIELIATLVLAGFVGALIMPFFYAGIFDSRTPMVQVANNHQLQSTAENIMEQFFEDYYNASMPLDGSQSSNSSYPMPAFADWLDSNVASLNASGDLKKLEVDYPFNASGPSPYMSDNQVARVVVEHISGVKYVFYLGQNNQ